MVASTKQNMYLEGSSLLITTGSTTSGKKGLIRPRSSRGTTQPTSSTGPKKSVRFAPKQRPSVRLTKYTNPNEQHQEQEDLPPQEYDDSDSEDGSNDVCCFVREFEKEDQALLDSLFWTHDELYETFEDEKDDFAAVEPIYSQTLRMAYDQGSQAMSSDVSIDLPMAGSATTTTADNSDHESELERVSGLSMHSLHLCSQARGLELDVFPSVKTFTKKHRRAVLIVQETLRNDGRDRSQDTCLELLRKASRRYSRPSRLVAQKLGEWDSILPKDDGEEEEQQQQQQQQKHDDSTASSGVAQPSSFSREEETFYSE
ncbi:hypothetical protein ACA910_004619 [Epithemia clementina (nom. ined.)]